MLYEFYIKCYMKCILNLIQKIIWNQIEKSWIMTRNYGFQTPGPSKSDWACPKLYDKSFFHQILIFQHDFLCNSQISYLKNEFFLFFHYFLNVSGSGSVTTTSGLKFPIWNRVWIFCSLLFDHSYVGLKPRRSAAVSGAQRRSNRMGAVRPQ